MSRKAAPAFAFARKYRKHDQRHHALPGLRLYRQKSMRERRYYTYIMASRSRVLYTGITNDIVVRSRQHKSRQADGFTASHRCTRLVWYQVFNSPSAAIAREKQVKSWRRAKRIALIEENNLGWHDLSEGWGQPILPLNEQPAQN
jgi:putative endonuclease